MFEHDEIIATFFDKNQRKSPLQLILVELESMDVEKQPLATLMLHFSAIDLLAQYHSGSLSPKSSTKRFIRFVRDMMRLTPNDAEMLYQVRNAAIHNQGSYAFNPANKKEYRFTYGQESRLFESTGSTFVEVSIPRLVELTQEALTNYQKLLKQSEEARGAFHRLYKKRGVLPS